MAQNCQVSNNEIKEYFMRNANITFKCTNHHSCLASYILTKKILRYEVIEWRCLLCSKSNNGILFNWDKKQVLRNVQQNTLLRKGIRLVKKRIVRLERKYLSRKMNCINHFPKYNTFPVAKKFWYKKVKEFWVYTYSQT